MGKTLKTIAIGAAMVGAAFVTGGAALIPAVTAGGVTAGATLATTTLGGLLLGTGVSTVLGGIAGALQGTPKMAEAQRGRLQVSIDPSTPRKMAFGRTAFATDLRYSEPSGQDDEYVDYIIACAAHAVHSIDEIWLEDRRAWTLSGGAQAPYVGYLTVNPRPEGTAANAIAINGGAKWGASRRLTGCAYVHLRIKRSGNSKKVESPLLNGLPSRVTIVGRGAKMYDPRFDGTVPGGSGPMRAHDQSTWAYSYGGVELGENPALQALWYQLGWRINGKLSVGLGIPPARLSLPSYIVSANLSDEPVALAAGGSEPRYRSAGLVADNDNPQTVLGEFAASCNAAMRDAVGRIAFDVRYNDLADFVALGDDDILAGADWDPEPSGAPMPNIARGRRTDPSDLSLYQLVDFPEVSVPSLDGIPRVSSRDYPLVKSAGQAQRLAKQSLQRAQYPGAFTAQFGYRAWACQVGRIVRLTYGPLGWTNKPFRVVAMTIGHDGIVPMELREENAAVYAWEAEDSPAVQPAEPTRFNPMASPLLAAVDAAGSTALWAQVSGPGKPDTYVVRAAGASATPPFGLGGVGLFAGDGTQISGLAGMYSVAVLHPTLHTWQVQSFNTHDLGQVAAMTAHLQNVAINLSGAPLVVYSWDEPSANRSEALKAIMYQHGGSAVGFGRNMAYRCAYALISTVNAGPGNGAEYYAQGDAGAWIDRSFSIVNGSVTVGNSPISDARDLIYTDGTPVQDLRPSQAGADMTASNVALGFANQGALATRSTVGTDHIELGAVTSLAGFGDFTGASWAGTGDWVTVAAQTITTAATDTVLVLGGGIARAEIASASGQMIEEAQLWMRVLRDGGIIRPEHIIAHGYGVPSALAIRGPLSVIDVDTPGPGPHTYSIQLRAIPGSAAYTWSSSGFVEDGGFVPVILKR
jgi:hypothetical protein